MIRTMKRIAEWCGLSWARFDTALGLLMEASRQRRSWIRRLSLDTPLVPVTAIISFVLWAHLGSHLPIFRSQVHFERGWEQFRAAYRINDFGEDGYFVRAVQNGYNVFNTTPRYAWRFTRKTSVDRISACASCHTPEDMAYGFVNSDRFDARIGRRVSFEERIMRCFAEPMDGFVPTLYDPVVRDLRIFARAVAYHLQLSEGATGAENRPFLRPK